MTNKSLDISLTIGGDAGQGVESSGAGLCKAFTRGGLEVFSLSDYQSRIRGGHNFFQIRVSDQPIFSHADPVQLVIALTRETIDVHLSNTSPDAGIIYDDEFGYDAKDIKRQGRHPLPMPLTAVAKEFGNRVMLNTAAIAAAAAVLNYPLHYLEKVIEDNFSVKGPKVVEANLAVARKAYRVALERHGTRFSWSLPVGLLEQVQSQGQRMTLHGNHAIALGAVAAGCRFISAYPMTPGTSVFEWITAHAKELGIVSKHAEDEIAAVCMAVGANAVGARAMTTTSGGGFSLMTEALGMAGMVELPLVIVLAQRGGPSTGLATRTEQGDLLFALHASQGEFPRIVLAPNSVSDCFDTAWRAFNLADKYQCPVILMTDQFLASSLNSLPIDTFDLDKVVIDRGLTIAPDEPLPNDDPYLRYAFTDDGISPRALPGHPSGMYSMTTDEHTPDSHISEDSVNREKMMRKRMQKLVTAARYDMEGPGLYGPETAEVTLICWGSLYGPCREAVNILNEQQKGQANLVYFRDIWPLPNEKVMPVLDRIGRGIVVEQNYSGQFARFLQMHLGFKADQVLTKYDGRQFTPGEIVDGIRKEALVYG